MIFHKYGSINNIKKNTEVLNYDVCITEKVHGTNIRFTCKNNNLQVGSRNREIYNENSFHLNSDNGYGFAEWLLNHPCVNIIKSNPELWDHIFYGEFYGDGIQKGIKYCNGKDFRLFDIRNPEGEFVDWEEVERIAKKIKLQTMPVLFRGKLNNAEQLNQFININSTIALENGIELEDNIAEGIVVKTLKTLYDRRGNRLIIKYKSTKWCENNDVKVAKVLTQEEVNAQAAARDFAEKVVTKGRVHTIVEHITRDGDTEIDIKRMSDFLKEMNKDIEEEHSEFFNSLEKKDKKLHLKTISSYASKAFKDYLMEN